MKRGFCVGLLYILATVGCNPTEAGDDCDDESVAICESDHVALFCDDGVFKAVQCRGDSGCSSNSSRAICFFGPFQVGDACPNESERETQCDPSNPNQALQCSSGTVKVIPCNACEVRADRGVYCLP